MCVFSLWLINRLAIEKLFLVSPKLELPVRLCKKKQLILPQVIGTLMHSLKSYFTENVNKLTSKLELKLMVVMTVWIRIFDICY